MDNVQENVYHFIINMSNSLMEQLLMFGIIFSTFYIMEFCYWIKFITGLNVLKKHINVNFKS
jgi:hypothetical protein